MKLFSMPQDAMSVARNIIKNPKLVPGGGATEMTVSAALKQKSSSIEGIEKVSVFHCCFSEPVDTFLYLVGSSSFRVEQQFTLVLIFYFC
jgi:hypothetical protein